jgi:hypothetical protein
MEKPKNSVVEILLKLRSVPEGGASQSMPVEPSPVKAGHEITTAQLHCDLGEFVQIRHD